MADEEALDGATARRLLARTARAQRDLRLPSLVAGVARSGRTLWSAGRGRVGDGAPGLDTQYRIGSITKTFTAVLVLQLRDEGRLRLTDPVDRWLPGLGAASGRSVGELLAHTGGVRAETSPPWWERTPGRTWDDLVADLGPAGARDAQRGRHHYSNVGYAVLGQLVASHRGAPWPEVLAERVLAPLGLRRTTTMPVPPAAEGRAVHPWRRTLLPEPAHDALAMAPAGQLWSTAGDLLAFGRVLLGEAEDVLAAATVEEMVEARVPAWGTSDGYGLGVMVAADGDRVLVGHSGSMPGFLAHLRVDRDERLVGVALAATTAGLGPEVVDDLLGIVREHVPHVAEEWVPLSDADAGPDDLLGVWYWGPSPFTVSAGPERDVLTLEAVAPRAGHPTRLDLRGREWRGRGGYFDGEPLVVVRDAAGAVTHFELASFVFTRQPYEPPEVVPGGAGGTGERGPGAGGAGS